MNKVALSSGLNEIIYMKGIATREFKNLEFAKNIHFSIKKA